MRPFNLEAAKRGEPILVDGTGWHSIYFIGAKRNGLIQAEDESGHAYTFRPNQLRMAPRKGTFWVLGGPLYDKNEDGKLVFARYLKTPVPIEIEY